jgi:hypothetical protein
MIRKVFGVRAQGIAAMAVWLAMLGGLQVPASAAEPVLPPGLQTEPQEPALPPGLEVPGSEPTLPAGPEPPAPGPPPLPEGLGEPPAGAAEPRPEAPTAPLRIAGFWEVRVGARLRDSEHERRKSIGETRLQLDLEKAAAGVTFRLVADLLYDGLADTHAVDLNTGQGTLDLREANALFSPAAWMDIKAGRQILTWGTGDLLFINDLFPKDFVAFFTGRDEAYLKAPSDAFKVSGFSPWLGADLVYTPRFDADRFITGARISYYDPAPGRIVGSDADLQVLRPQGGAADDEWALRLYRNLGAYEVALYGYDGFWKSPAGADPVTGRATFPRLAVYGASLRGPLGPGIAHMELGRYQSRDDPRGDDPFIRNGESRVLVGYEQEAARNLTLGLQYYLERLEDYDAYRATLPADAPPRDELRRVVTVRATWLTMNQNLVWSLFAFYSPTDEDAYVRPKVSYRIDDQWSAELGGNLFHGKEQHTFFGQLEDNSNAYAALRYGF